MIVKDITRFYDIRTGFAARIMAVGLAALLAVSFLNLAVLPSAALADEAGEGGEAGAAAATAEPVEQPQALPAPEDPAEGANVYVYLQLGGEALKAAKEAGLTLNGNGWFTVGVMAMEDIPRPISGATIPVDETQAQMRSQIAEALKSIDYYPGAEVLSLSAAQWTDLKVCDGATDYAVSGNAWHLDGILTTQLVNFDIQYIDADGNPLAVGDEDEQGGKTNTRTILAAAGSQVSAADQAIAIEGYEYSEAQTKEKNGGKLVVDVAGSPQAQSEEPVVEKLAIEEPDMTLVYKKKAEEPVTPETPDNNGGNPSDNPVVPGDNGNGSGNNGGTKPPAPSNTDVPKLPSITVPKPQAPQQTQGNANSGNTGAADNGGFAVGERTQLSEPAPQPEPAKVELAETATAEEPVLEAVSIDDDAVPMVARAAGAEAIAEEEVPMGAFDAPVDPAPWVAGMGAIGTALWGVVAVRRRLLMAQKLASFEDQVLGASAAEADAVAVPNAGHQVL